jgi:hypothetical protein
LRTPSEYLDGRAGRFAQGNVLIDAQRLLGSQASDVLHGREVGRLIAGLSGNDLLRSDGDAPEGNAGGRDTLVRGADGGTPLLPPDGTNDGYLDHTAILLAGFSVASYECSMLA